MRATKAVLVLAVMAVTTVGCGPGAENDGQRRPTVEGVGEGEGEGDAGREGEGEEEGAEGAEGEGEGEGEDGGTTIGFGGAGDFGFVRQLLAENRVPRVEDIDDVGFFAEHQTLLPPATCGAEVCPQAMYGVMGNMVDGRGCHLLQVGLNSTLRIDPAARPPLTMAVAVDISGSMAGEKLRFVQQGLRTLVNELADDDRLAIVTYSTGASVVVEMGPVAGRRNVIIGAIDDLVADGATNIFEGLDGAFGEVLGAFEGARQHRVLLLSDGVATAGTTSSTAIVAMAEGYVAEGIPLTTIGVGSDFDLTLMRTLAEEGDGNFYFLENLTAVDEVFTEEVAVFLLPVAFDVSLRVRLGSQWSLRNAYGARHFEVDDLGRGGSLVLPAVYLAGRRSDDDLFEGSGRRGGGSALLLELEPAVIEPSETPTDIGTIEVTFLAPGAVTTTFRAEGQTSPVGTTTPTRGHFENRIVEKSFVMLNILVGMRAAAQAFHLGAGSEAVDVIDGVMAAATDYEDSANDGAGDTDIRLDLELLQDFRDVLLRNGAVDEGTELPADPWPAD